MSCKRVLLIVFTFIGASACPAGQPVLLKTFDGFVGGFQDTRGFVPGRSLLYFAAEDGETDGERPSIWRSDGTPEGTVRVVDLNPDFYGGRTMATIGDQLFFFVAGENGLQLWRTNGTPGQAVLLHQMPVVEDWMLLPAEIVPVGNNYVYYAGYSGLHGRELWRADASSLSSTLAADLFPGDDRLGNKNSSSPSGLTAAGDSLFFSATDGVNGRELWFVDARGAVFLPRDIATGSTLAGPRSSSPLGITYAGRDDGTAAEYVLLSAQTSQDGRQLWRSDGTSAGTFQLGPIDAGTLKDANPEWITRAFGRAFFVAKQANVGRELWVTTTPGVALVKDIFPGNASGAPQPRDLFVLNDVLYFSADDGVHGREPWRSDGTPEGTYLLKDLVPGSVGSEPAGFIEHGGVIYFSAHRGDGPLLEKTLWQTDGTRGGTIKVDERYPQLGTLLGEPRYAAVVGPTLYLCIGESIWMIPADEVRFADWIVGQGLPLAERGHHADPDRDGRSNLLEYAFGGHPGRVDQGEVPSIGQVDGKLVLRFPAPRSDIEYRVEEAAGLSPGSAWGTGLVEERRDGTQVTAILPGDSVQKFYRVSVSLKP